MSAVRRKLAATAGALGLGLSIAAHATGSAAQAPAASGDRAAHAKSGNTRNARLEVLAKPTKHFDRSLEIAHRKAERSARLAQSQEASSASVPQGGAFPTPESLGVSSATLDSIAACESGGDPTAVSADGTYHGLYQFDYGTWASVGGSGDPAAASVAEQDYRAALLYSRSGSGAWPICG